MGALAAVRHTAWALELLEVHLLLLPHCLVVSLLTSSRTSTPVGCMSSLPAKLSSARRPGVPTTMMGL